ncbi:MAG: hypothetical protein JW985_03305 [Alphaproteobacteria bacterium]|nr:hypothetical protein [Alphaproteobacteria bacterium]
MKKYKTSFCSLVLALCSLNAGAEIRVGNHSRSYADDYNQVASMQATNAAISSDDLPIRVANKILATRIANGDSTAGVTISNLDSCKNIYPSGEFAWDIPMVGLKAGNPSTCVAVVEMRVVKGTSDIVVARANVAAGDSIECNISKFPESSYTSDVSSVVFPADAAPTMDDVISVMNAEQKKNAGFKIAAGAIVGGLVGNAAGKNDLGESNLIGSSQGKMQGTAIGALSGAALMTGSSYAGKVGGDMIMSAGVNAAAGGVVGNMVANGDSVLRIEDCTDLDDNKTTCLWGIIEEGKDKNGTAYYNYENGETYLCKSDGTPCEKTRLINVKFNGSDKDGKQIDKPLEDAKTEQTFFPNIGKKFSLDENTKQFISANGGNFVEIKSAFLPGERTMAMITGVKDTTFGLKMKDWYKMRGTLKNEQLIGRKSNGDSYTLNPEKKWDIADFYPLTRNADDGSLIDINNKARLKGTLVGAGTGAGLGAFTAYQGASDEIDARWISAVQEYKDSLQKVYCATGTRFLSQYNDLAVIPNMQ